MNKAFTETSSKADAVEFEPAADMESYLSSVERQVEDFESLERERLDIPKTKTEQWFDGNPTRFTEEQRAHTTILHSGLTMAHDLFIQSAFRDLGYKVEVMDVLDNRALQFGREFGNRGQCNPTYFTVGNLVKKLKALEAKGMDKKSIVADFVFATAGSCGPCRFGTYVTEYRKALRDAGFEGFRVLLFQQAGGMKQATGVKMGLKIDANFFLTMSKAVVLGDVLNAYMYRIRPYEVETGACDKAIDNARKRIALAFETRKGLLLALWRSRKEFAAIKVDRTQVKPRVAIIGEFWAMTTEGDGNYKMQRFLEEEGAEVEVQVVTNWALYLLWAARYDTLERAQLKGVDRNIASMQNGIGSKFSLERVNVAKKLMMIRGAEWFLRTLFKSYARLLGLKNYTLPDMEHIAEISHRFYDNNLRGGEGHMEVGKLIHNVVDNSVNMTLSIKPFGCMPSSAVSDGAQSLITELYPEAIFLPIETNGDGAVNVYSRVQMQLFKAKKSAEEGLNQALELSGLDIESFKDEVGKNKAMMQANYRSKHRPAASCIDLAYDVASRKAGFVSRLGSLMASPIRYVDLLKGSHKKDVLTKVSRAAENFRRQKQSASSEQVVQFVEP
ncbi:MAG: putative nucleotide-binding protein (sugar kinase/HSP70/actin superfamily) [Flavobacteriales bacterium]|jgi:predicted nucleotide-binding protein (sugar kinase/HSP70/actin superfamily)